jgi:hypothetical protein
VVGLGGTLASLMSMALFLSGRPRPAGRGHLQKSILLICGSAYVVAWIIFNLGVPRIKPVKIKESWHERFEVN